MPPSERTVETSSNHNLIEIVNAGKAAPPFAWVRLPTQNEEVHLGYDAALEGMKLLVIQYKSINNTGSFSFDFRQIWLLCALFPRTNKSYVFLAGNTSPFYATMTADYAGAARYTNFDSAFFLDAWKLLDAVVSHLSGGGFALPPVLPVLPILGSHGCLTLSPSAVGFRTKLKLGTKSVQSLSALMSACGFGGGLIAGTPAPLLASGWGQGFALDVKNCLFGIINPLNAVDAPIDPEIQREQNIGLGNVSLMYAPVAL